MRCDSKPTNYKLIDTKKSVLVQWILSMDQRGLAPRATDVQRMANLLLAKQLTNVGESVSTVGKYWVYNFVQ